MAQISTANLQSILDKIARHAAEVSGDTLATAVATAANYTENTPAQGLLTANSDVLSALDTLVKTTIADGALDRLMFPAVDQLNNQNPVPNAYLAALWNAAPFPGAKGVLDGLDAYALDPQGGANALTLADTSGLDAMLRVLNATTPTLRVHELFSKYLRKLAPANVFPGRVYQLGTIAVTGATAGTLTLTTGGLYTGPTAGLLDTSRFGPCQLAIRNTKTEGLASMVVTMTVLKNGVSTSVTFTVANVTNTRLTACSDPTLTMTGLAGTGGAAGLAGCALVSIAGGVNTDTFDLVLLPDRTINAA